jgi:hypothetical protein
VGTAGNIMNDCVCDVRNGTPFITDIIVTWHYPHKFHKSAWFFLFLHYFLFSSKMQESEVFHHDSLYHINKINTFCCISRKQIAFCSLKCIIQSKNIFHKIFAENSNIIWISCQLLMIGIYKFNKGTCRKSTFVV